MPEPTLVSTDIGTDLDDALALVLLARHPDRFDLRGVYTAAGPVELRARIAKKLLDLLGASAPVGVGESKPFVDEPSKIYMVTSGFEPLLLTKREQKHVSRSGVRIVPDGVSHLEQQLARAEEPVTLISLAPLTNIARLLQQFPSAPQRVRQLYIMGGNTLPEIPEHNFLNDIEAARLVLASDFHVTLVPADSCSGYELPFSVFDYARHRPDPPLKAYLQWMATIWQLHTELSKFTDNVTPILSSPDLPVSRETRNLIDFISNRNGYIKDFRRTYYIYHIFKNYLKLAETPVERLIRIALSLSKKETIVPHDAYVAYALLHPERVETRRATVTVEGVNGVTILGQGDKHAVVTGFDYAHAGSFFEQHFCAH